VTTRARTAPRRAQTRRTPRSRTTRGSAGRRALGLLLGLAVVGVAIVAIYPHLHHAVKEIALPLRHEDIIRQQAREKDLEPDLIAAVIYAESKFRDQTSSAGAKGLMQITPATAQYIADRSGGTAFELEDLSTPQVNISYGSFYLRYLLDRYGGNETLALAAYNAGEGNVDTWLAEAGRKGERLGVDDIPFPETRRYVQRVQDAQRDYRREYAGELGL
jgi:soluble lytic murein transglycosylase